MEEELTTREMRPEERRLLKDFLYEAVFVPEGAEKTTSPVLPAKNQARTGKTRRTWQVLWVIYVIWICFPCCRL